MEHRLSASTTHFVGSWACHTTYRTWELGSGDQWGHCKGTASRYCALCWSAFHGACVQPKAQGGFVFPLQHAWLQGSLLVGRMWLL